MIPPTSDRDLCHSFNESKEHGHHGSALGALFLGPMMYLPVFPPSCAGISWRKPSESEDPVVVVEVGLGIDGRIATPIREDDLVGS